MTKEIVQTERLNDMSRENPLKKLRLSVNEAVEGVAGDNFEVEIAPAPGRVKSDYGIQLARVAKLSDQKLPDLAGKVKDGLDASNNPLIEHTEVMGPYLNINLEMNTFGEAVIGKILSDKKEYGKENIGEGKIVAIDMSSPNIAKRMSYGHLRSTVIGDALARMYKAEGYKVIKDNHIGDWGTQFGKLIVAIKKWGDEKEIIESEDPIGVLQDYYVKFHDEMEAEQGKTREEYKIKVEKNGLESMPELSEAVEKVSQNLMTKKKLKRYELNMETILEDALDEVVVTGLEDEAREWFAKLENRDPEAQRIWQLCVDLSMKEFDKIYQFLGIEFDVVHGESYYQDMLPDVISEVKDSGVGIMSDGALVVDMKDRKLETAIVQKKDGASVYMTRDIATALHREKELNADKAVYVVGADQKLYFRQLFEILKRLDHPIGEESVHTYFGMVSLPDGKMSTRKGRVILLKDVITEGLNRSGEVLKKTNPELYKDKEKREEVLKQITVGALKWNDLAEDPKRNIVFKWDDALNLDGYSAPYVQYSGVRANSILRKAEESGKYEGYRDGEYEFAEGSDGERELVKKLAVYPYIITEALELNNPSKIARYSYELSQAFNNFYTTTSVLKAESDSLVNSRLKLVEATSQVLTNALDLLGISIPESM